jgi:hypothetical protein
VCQADIDAAVLLTTVECDGITKVIRADCEKKLVEVRAEAAEGWPWWQVSTVGGALILIGAAIGYGFTHVKK